MHRTSTHSVLVFDRKMDLLHAGWTKGIKSYAGTKDRRGAMRCFIEDQLFHGEHLEPLRKDDLLIAISDAKRRGADATLLISDEQYEEFIFLARI